MPTFNATVQQGAEALGDSLEAAGYTSLFPPESSLDRLLSCERNAWLRLWDRASSLATLERDLFGFGFFHGTLPAVRALQILPEKALRSLHALGVLRVEPEGVSLPRHVLLCVPGGFLLGPSLLRAPSTPEQTLYLGRDSLRLIAAVQRDHEGVPVFEVGAGTGVVGVALRSSRYLASEIDSVAARIAGFNLALNRRREAAVLQGDLLQPYPTGDRRLVASNPPYVPAPPEYPLARCSHGGADGLDSVRRLVSAWLERHASPTLIFIVHAYGADRPEALETWLATLADRCDIHANQLGATRLEDDDFLALAKGCARVGDRAHCVKSFRSHYAAHDFRSKFDVIITVKRLFPGNTHG